MNYRLKHTTLNEHNRQEPTVKTKNHVPKTNTVIRNLRVIPELDTSGILISEIRERIGTTNLPDEWRNYSPFIYR